jgi:hypothetical protein
VFCCYHPIIRSAQRQLAARRARRDLG